MGLILLLETHEPRLDRWLHFIPGRMFLGENAYAGWKGTPVKPVDGLKFYLEDAFANVL